MGNLELTVCMTPTHQTQVTKKEFFV